MCQIALILASIGTANAVNIPSPELPYGNDSIRTPDGFQCSSAVSPSSYLDAGMYQDESNGFSQPQKGVYVRVMVPLYSGVKRLDCSKLYEQVLQERMLEKKLADVKARVFATN